MESEESGKIPVMAEPDANPAQEFWVEPDAHHQTSPDDPTEGPGLTHEEENVTPDRDPIKARGDWVERQQDKDYSWYILWEHILSCLCGPLSQEILET